MSVSMETEPATQLSERLRVLLGANGVLTGADVVPYATDVYRSRELPLAVVRPGTVEELQAAVLAATDAGVAVFVRGGGASYTDGYLPSVPRSILVDMGGLARIVDLNEADGYVTVEAGITWATLKAALDARGLRTPFFGPFSGIAATVGGSVSQNSISHGSGTHGISAQSVISLDVVTASGALLRTGSAARGSPPFLRWYGPDLTGLFTGDCGALGVKARVTLSLLKRLPAFECVSFGFDTLGSLAGALRVAALEHIDDEHFAIDNALSQGQIARQERISKFVTAKDLWNSAPSATAAIKQLFRSAQAGTRELRASGYTLHFVVEGLDQREAQTKANRLRVLMQENAGSEIANTVAAVVRATPFAPLFNTLGPNGERWVPLHGHVPHSQVSVLHDSMTQLFASRADEMERLGIWHGGMFMTIGTTAFLYEVALYWPGVPSAYHVKALPADYLAALPQHAHSAEAAAFIEQLKHDIIAVYDRCGAVHFQIGKMYPYATRLSPEALGLMRALKTSLDPRGLMNPGALGL